MANTLIQIKYSDTNPAPTYLNVAEPGYSYVSNTLFIGNETSDGFIAIGGRSEIVRLNAVHQFANTINASLANVSTLVQPAFDKANAANILAQNSYNFGNTVNIKVDSAYAFANSVNAELANVSTLIQPAFNKANSAYDNSNTKLSLSGGTITGPISGPGESKLDFTTYGSNTAYLTTTNDDYTALFLTAASAELYANATVQIRSNTKGTSQNWTFGEDGSLTLPTNGTISGLKDLNVTGNLTVVGQTVYANTETVLIKDNIITLNAAISQSGSPVANAGIEIDRGSSANASLIWDETSDRWVYSSDGTTYYGIADAARLDSAFTQANSANVIAQAGFDKANSANVLAQAAYNAANNAGGTVVANTITLGANSAGELVSNAVTLTTATTVTNGLAQLNQILGKLVPQSPGAFPNSTSLSVSTLSTYRMTNFTQTDRTTTASKQASAGSTVTSVRRASSYTTNTFADVGPGESGTLTLVKNNVATGAVTFTASSANGTYSDLIITDSKDYSLTGRISAANFWRSFDCQGSGTVANGWNEIYLSHTGGANTSTIPWYYDDSAPGTPTFATPTIVPSSTTVIYSSTVPHYTSATTFLLGVNVSKLSGDMYPTSNTFFTGTAGGAFGAPTSNTYPAVGITVMARNYLVASGSLVVNSTSTIVSGFGSSSTGPSVTVDNSYSTASQAFTTALANTVLYKTGTASSMEETTITFGSAVGTGSGLAARIINPGTTDTPAYSAGASLFNSQSSTLTANDATIVASTLKHDQINYSTGYLPAGPNLSTGRTGAQYFTFRFVRTSVSKFDIQFTGTIAGMWVALPGSSIDTAAAATNGWIDMSIAYGGSGVPTSGASVGGVVTLNSAVTNHRKTCTFGTVSSSSTATNEIYVRIKLTSGQTVTALTLQTASN